jgi:hypothetical protein
MMAAVIIAPVIIAVTIVAKVTPIFAAGLAQVAAAVAPFAPIFPAAVGAPQVTSALAKRLPNVALILAIVAIIGSVTMIRVRWGDRGRKNGRS